MCWIQVYLSQPNPIRALMKSVCVKTLIMRITFNKVRLILNLTPRVLTFCDCALGSVLARAQYFMVQLYLFEGVRFTFFEFFFQIPVL